MLDLDKEKCPPFEVIFNGEKHVFDSMALVFEFEALRGITDPATLATKVAAITKLPVDTGQAVALVAAFAKHTQELEEYLKNVLGRWESLLTTTASSPQKS